MTCCLVLLICCITYTYGNPNQPSYSEMDPKPLYQNYNEPLNLEQYSLGHGITTSQMPGYISDETVGSPKLLPPFGKKFKLGKIAKGIRHLFHPFLLYEQTPVEFLDDVENESDLLALQSPQARSNIQEDVHNCQIFESDEEESPDAVYSKPCTFEASGTTYEPKEEFHRTPRHFHAHHTYHHGISAPHYVDYHHETPSHHYPVTSQHLTVNPHSFTPSAQYHGASNVQIAQPSGSDNEVHQSQGFSHENSHIFQSSQIFDSPLVSRPYIIQVPRRRFVRRDQHETSSRNLNTDSTQSQVSLVDHLLNPNSRLDVPKTLENAGAFIKNTLEHEEAPLFHVKNAVASAKDAFMSTLKIPPQNLIIPSKYRIVESEHDQLQRNNETDREPEDPAEYFLNTYMKIGNMLRESVRSGQEALAHLVEVTHNARNAINAARSVAPKILQPQTENNPLIKRLDTKSKGKLVVVTPKILEFKHANEIVGEPRSSQTPKDFVGIGHVLDSLGISNPSSQKVDLLQTEFYPRNVIREYVNEDVATALSMSPPEIQETLDTLDNAQRAVGAYSLQDFFAKLKGSFKRKLLEAKQRIKVRVYQKDDGNMPTSSFQDSDLVQATRQSLPEVTNNTSDACETVRPNLTKQQSVVPDATSSENEIEDGEPEVGAINPAMYKKIVNESLDAAKPVDLSSVGRNGKKAAENKDDVLGVSMIMGPKLVTPFMGKVPQQVVDVYYDDVKTPGYQDNPNYGVESYLGTTKSETKNISLGKRNPCQ